MADYSAGEITFPEKYNGSVSPQTDFYPLSSGLVSLEGTLIQEGLPPIRTIPLLIRSVP